MATFKARARALDMLGRQQIAGIPTAISELFKNAHDAYADTVEVDYYRSDGLFVLRDDGLGMTHRDFLDRWLALGTESKLNLGGGVPIPPVHPSKPARPILGEKGIGRLAIAAIGPQVLIITRAIRDNVRQDVVAAFINWRLFEVAGADLDQIDVPVVTLASAELLTRDAFRAMRDQVCRNVERLQTLLDRTIADDIIAEITGFDIDPADLSVQLGPPSLSADGHGTQFFIRPADPMLSHDIDGGTASDRAPNLTRYLIGFANTMSAAIVPAITTRFRDHRLNETTEELVAPSEFFTPTELSNADHRFRGRFDAYGQFRGTVSIYGEEHPGYVVPWTPARGSPTACGPFTIDFGYVQGKPDETTLPLSEYARISEKLRLIGGLYVYRDGIRVLPYGNNDYDFLDIERNRTKSASYYFFSYRRMFGYIEVNQSDNHNLSEKAGREGFRENLAYRQLVSILRDFFPQLAADFFRETGVSSDHFVDRRAELRTLSKARAKREKLVSTRREQFRNAVAAVLSRIDGNEAHTILAAVEAETEMLATAAAVHGSEDRGQITLVEIEMSARQRVREIRDGFVVSKPSGTGLTKQLRRDWEAYGHEFVKLDEQVFQPAIRRIDAIIDRFAPDGRAGAVRRERLDLAVQGAAAAARRAAGGGAKAAREAISDLNTRATECVREIVRQMDDTAKNIELRCATTNVEVLTDDAIHSFRESLLSELDSTAERCERTLQAIRDQLSGLSFGEGDDGDASTAEMAEALEEEVLELRERTDADMELAQLGMAIGVINHEFQTSIRSIRQNIQALGEWARKNPGLAAIHAGIRNSFEHLDAYLTLFTPLNRRLYRAAVRIHGYEIDKFLRNLFVDRLQDARVRLSATPEFMSHIFLGFPSSFYPAFVNLVDNSIFWLRDRPEPRNILLDFDKGSMIVSDSGPGIPNRDAEIVFELGFSRKPGGRGLGLSISRDILRREGYDLSVHSPGPLGGALFRITPADASSEGGDDEDVR